MIIDGVQDVLIKGKKNLYTIKLPDKMSLSIQVWDKGTLEAFLIDAQEAIGVCMRKGHFKDFDKVKEVIISIVRHSGSAYPGRVDKG